MHRNFGLTLYQAPDGFMAVRIQHVEFVIQTDETEFFL